MNTNHPDVPWMDPNFLENSRKFPNEELMRYAGQHIAWSWDGTKILASGPDRPSLYENLETAGIDRSRVVFDFVDDPNVSYL